MVILVLFSDCTKLIMKRHDNIEIFASARTINNTPLLVRSGDMVSKSVTGTAMLTVNYSRNRLKVYTVEEIAHCERSKTIAKYINAKKIQAESTAMAYKPAGVFHVNK